MVVDLVSLLTNQSPEVYHITGVELVPTNTPPPLMTEVNTWELSGKALDWAVAKALKYPIFMTSHCDGEYQWPGNAHITSLSQQHDIVIVGCTGCITIEGPDTVELWIPTEKWTQCGQLITRYCIGIEHELVGVNDSVWYAHNEFLDGWCSAGTPQSAICIAAVITELGDSIKVPSVLV